MMLGPDNTTSNYDDEKEWIVRDEDWQMVVIYTTVAIAILIGVTILFISILRLLRFGRGEGRCFFCTQTSARRPSVSVGRQRELQSHLMRYHDVKLKPEVNKMASSDVSISSLGILGPNSDQYRDYFFQAIFDDDVTPIPPDKTAGLQPYHHPHGDHSQHGNNTSTPFLEKHDEIMSDGDKEGASTEVMLHETGAPLTLPVSYPCDVRMSMPTIPIILTPDNSDWPSTNGSSLPATTLEAVDLSSMSVPCLNRKTKHAVTSLNSDLTLGDMTLTSPVCQDFDKASISVGTILSACSASQNVFMTPGVGNQPITEL